MRHLDWPSKVAGDDANDALVDGREADFGLIDQQQTALRLDDELGGRARVLGALGAVQQAQQPVELGLDLGIRRSSRTAACTRRRRCAP